MCRARGCLCCNGRIPLLQENKGRIGLENSDGPPSQSEEQPPGAPPTHAAHPAQEPFTFGNSSRNVAGHIFCFADFCSFACSKLDDQLWKLWEIFLAMTMGRQNPCSLVSSFPPSSLCYSPFPARFLPLLLSFSLPLLLCFSPSLLTSCFPSFLPSYHRT